MEIINGKIYCLKSTQTDKIYIGSTKQKLIDRFYKHKSDYKNKKENEKKSSFEITQYDDCYVEIIREVICSKKQLLQLEGEEILKHDNCINKIIAGSVKKYNDYKEYKKEYDKKYRTENKCECECGVIIQRANKSHHIKTNKHKKYLSRLIL